MGQERISDLALLSIENRTAENIDFDDLIDQFASLKTRQVSLWHSIYWRGEFIPIKCYKLYVLIPTLQNSFKNGYIHMEK